MHKSLTGIKRDANPHNAAHQPIAHPSVETLEHRCLLSASVESAYDDPAASDFSAHLTVIEYIHNDFNRDGFADALHYDALTGVLQVWHMAPGQRLDIASISGVGRGWELAATGDFNGDSKTDLVWHNPAMNTNAIWLMDGLTRSTSYYVPAVADGWKIVGSGDWNGDNQHDLVWRNTQTGAATVWHMNGHQLQTNTPFAALPWVATQDWQIGLVDDLDRDGQTDLLWTNATTGQASYWRMNGAAPVANGIRGFALPASNDWTLKTAVDNGLSNSRPLLWYNTRTSSLVTWQLNNLANPAGKLLIDIGVVELL